MSRHRDLIRGRASSFARSSSNCAAWGRRFLSPRTFLSELSTICDSIGIIESGKLVTAGECERDPWQSAWPPRVHHQTATGERRRGGARQTLERHPGTRSIEAVGGELRVGFDASEEEIWAILKSLVDNGVAFTEVREDIIDLETAFMTLTKGEIS